MVVEGWNQLLEEQGQQNGADAGEVEVVDHEQGVQLQGWSVTHQLPSTEDYNVVCKNCKSALLQG